MAGVLGALLEGFAAEQADPFPGHPFTTGDQVRVSVGGGSKAVTGRVMRPHGGPPPTHAVVAPDGGGAHVLAPVASVKLNTPAQHAAAQKRREAAQQRQQQQQAHAAWMAAKPPGSKPPGSVVEAFMNAGPNPTVAQSNAVGAASAGGAQAALARGWNPSKHPRAQGGKFGYTTGGKRATRARPGKASTTRSRTGKGNASSPRTLNTGAQGALVQSIQRQLNVPADGRYGPQTKAAVARYQQQHGLQVDGVVGRQTLASLRGSTNARLVAPGPISSKQATVRTHPAARSSRKAKAPAKAPASPKAPVRVGGGLLV